MDFLGLGSGGGPDLGSLVLGLGAWGRRAQEVVRQWEMLLELRNFVRADTYFDDGVACESQEWRHQTRLVMRAQAEMTSLA